MLQRLGFTGVCAGDLILWQGRQAPLPRRPIVLTFDDGYASVAEAIPALLKVGWSATIFAVSGHVGGWNEWDTACPPTRLLDAATLRELAGHGIEIGSHTRRHRRVTTLSEAEARDELHGARLELQAVIERPVSVFSFPYGTHDRASLERVVASGYTGAVTLKRWANPRSGNPYRLGRMSVGGPLPAWKLAAKLGKMLLTPART